MFLLQCPKCKNRMNYSTRDRYLTGKKKKCVYCGFSMKAGESVVKKVQ